MMRKIIGLFILVLFILPFASRLLQASETPTTVGVNFTGVFDDANTSIDFNTSATYGAYFNLAAPSRSTYSFAFWIVNGVVRYDLAPSSSIRVTSDMNISAVYSPSGKNTVLFIDSNGKILGTEFVVSGQTVQDPDLTSHVGKPGLTVKTVDTWKTPQGLVYSEELTISSNTVFILQYEVTNPSNTFEVTVNNGIGSGTYTYNQVVTVTANPTQFSHWEDNGVVVSRSLSYSFTVLSARTLTAVSSASPQADTPVVTMTNDLALRNTHNTYMGQFYLPSNYELVEYGFIISNRIESITRSTAGVTVAQSSIKNETTNEFVMSFPLESHMTARAYLVYKDEFNNLDTSYSILNAQLPVEYDKHETFSNLTIGGSYVSGTFVGDDYSWNYNQARGDVAVSGKAIMLQNTTTSYLSTEISSGIGHLQLTFTKAFSTNAAVEMFINDVLIETSPVSTVANSPLIFNVYNINISGQLTLRFETTSGQLLIDDIKWTNYGIDTGFSPVISGVQNTTSLKNNSYNPLSGITASDFEDGNLTNDVEFSVFDSNENLIESPVDFSLLNTGAYTITYSVTDSSSKTKTVTKTHTIGLGNAPVINGAIDLSLQIDSVYNPLTGITVSDVEDGNLTSSLSYSIKDDLDQTVESIDTSSAGIFLVTYSVTDSQGNLVTATIEVEVVDGVVTLSSPANVVLNQEEEKITWDVVAGAASYTVLVGSFVFEDQTTNEIDLRIELLDNNKQYEVSVIAVGDGFNTLNSDPSQVINYLRLRYNDLIISGYYYDNTTSNNVKTVSIFNGTGNTKTLTDYRLCQWSNVSTSGVVTINGCTGVKADSSSISPTYTLAFGGIYQTVIKPYETIIIGVTTTAFTSKATSLQSNLYSNTSINFNGAEGDVIVLSKGTNVTIDIIGKTGSDLTWETNYTAAKKLLVRKPVLSGPNTSINWLDSTSVTTDWISSSNIIAADVTNNFFNWSKYSSFTLSSIPE